MHHSNTRVEIAGFLAGVARADNSIEVHQGGVAGGQCAQHQD